MTEPTFTFDGQEISIRAGQSIAAALTDHGVRAFRETAGGAKRGMFCGMGVCQECLVCIDGTPNQRACMTPATPGQSVVTQTALPPLEAPRTQKSGIARVLEPDVLVVGAGAGGLSAAIAARRAGAEVVVVDERKVPGGQYFKQSAVAPPMDDQQAQGAELVEAARASGADLLGGVEIWGAFDGPLILAAQNGEAQVFRPKAVIVATGAYERPIMVPGWTLPGVMTTGAAQTLWRSYRTLAGKRVAVCGSGPLNLQVALELAEGGAEVVRIAEAAPAPIRRPLAALAMCATGPGLALRGVGMLRRLRARGIVPSYETKLYSVSASGNGLKAAFLTAEGKQETSDVDAVCMNAGFDPQNEILRLFGAELRFDPQFAHFRCVRDDRMQTSVPCIYAVGDCAGLGGAPAAMVEGRIAGRAAAATLGYGEAYDDFADQRILGRHRRFQKHLWRLYRPGAPDIRNSPDEMVLCRCEEISLGEVRENLSGTPQHVGTLKRATRLGMGRCQGRYCGPVAARMLAQASGQGLGDRSHFAPRVPIKPVSIAAIMAAQDALDDPA